MSFSHVTGCRLNISSCQLIKLHRLTRRRWLSLSMYSSIACVLVSVHITPHVDLVPTATTLKMTRECLGAATHSQRVKKCFRTSEIKCNCVTEVESQCWLQSYPLHLTLYPDPPWSTSKNLPSSSNYNAWLYTPTKVSWELSPRLYQRDSASAFREKKKKKKQQRKPGVIYFVLSTS